MERGPRTEATCAQYQEEAGARKQNREQRKHTKSVVGQKLDPAQGGQTRCELDQGLQVRFAVCDARDEHVAEGHCNVVLAELRRKVSTLLELIALRDLEIPLPV